MDRWMDEGGEEGVGGREGGKEDWMEGRRVGGREGVIWSVYDVKPQALGFHVLGRDPM